MKLAVNVKAAAANGGSPAAAPVGAPAGAPTGSPAPAPHSTTTPVSGTPFTGAIAPSPDIHSPATRSPVPKSAATSISFNRGKVVGVLTGLLLFLCI